VQQVGVASGIYRLVKTLGFSALLIALALFFIYIEIPWYVGAVVIFIAVAIVVVDIISLKRMTRVDLNTPNEPVSENVELELGEYLVDTIPAVMQYGKTRSVEILDTGKVLTPENTLIITNRAIWTVTVPLSGGDKVVSGTDIGKWQWMMAYQDIIKILQEMVTTLPLDEVLKQGRAKRLMRMEEIKRAKSLPFTYAISLTRTDGKKFGYSIRTKEDYMRAKEIFKIS
jgi:hypothetical protein